LAKVTALLSGTTIYIDLPPPESELLPKGKVYVSVDLTNPPTIPGLGDVDALAGFGDPGQLLTAIQGGITSATKAEKGTTEGIVTTHYVVQVNLANIATPAATMERKLLGGNTLTNDLYVGPDNRLVKLVTKVPLTGNAVETLTAVYSDYGGAVQVIVPAASKVVSAQSLLSTPT
jgi:hypothetical protein